MKPICTKLLLLAVLAAASHAEARVFTVNSSADLPDSLPGDGICNALPPGPPPACTLRAAFDEAELADVSDVINIPANLDIVLPSAAILFQRPGKQLEVIGGTNLFDPESRPRIDGNNASNLFHIFSGDVTLRNLQLVNGRMDAVSSTGGAAFSAGQFATVRLENINFSGNTVLNSQGGAVANLGTMEIINSNFDLNFSTGNGGAIRNRGDLILRNSSIYRSRSATNEAAVIFSTSSPGNSSPNLTVVNSLIEGDTSFAGESGGIFAFGAGNVTINNSTLVGFTRRALRIDSPVAGAVISLRNSILADTTQSACAMNGLNGIVPTIDYNLIDDNSCAGSNQLGGSPNLGPLQLPVGSTVRSRTPVLGSPVIDAGNPGQPFVIGACASTDQRGTPRPLDGNADGIARCDLGAIEASAFTASTFVVNLGVADLVDANPGDGLCATAIGSNCTLRAAVMEANAKPGPDRIEFAPNVTAVSLTIDPAASANGGDLDITEALTIEGSLSNGRPVVAITQSRAGERLFEVNAPATQPVAINNLSLRSGDSPTVSGGALRITGGADVSVDNVEFTDNLAANNGGAISVVNGSLLLTDSDLHGNSAQSLGTALFVDNGASAVVQRTSFWGNTDSNGGTSREAIHVASGGSLVMRGSTVAFNDGGVAGATGSSLRIKQSTLAYNQDRGVDMAFLNDPDSLWLHANILAFNGMGQCVLVNSGAANTLDVDNFNLFGSAAGACSTGPTNFIADPALLVNPAPSQLTQPSGRLSRVLPLFYQSIVQSPAVDAAPNSGLFCDSSDGRGLPRPRDVPTTALAVAGRTCDIGAYEVQPPPPAGPEVIFANGFEPD